MVIKLANLDLPLDLVESWLKLHFGILDLFPVPAHHLQPLLLLELSISSLLFLLLLEE